MTAPSTIATTYIRAWIDKDFNTLRGLLADDVTFSGPLLDWTTPMTASRAFGRCRRS